MLYKLEKEKKKFSKIYPIDFYDFSDYGHNEKDLENLIADNLLEVLFEESTLLTITQERKYQAEADIYALNEYGELIIFELKRNQAGDDAVQQGLRYAQVAGQWSYKILQRKFQQYIGEEIELATVHQESFGLDEPLLASEFNRNQHIFIIGGASDDELCTSVDYWSTKGLPIKFLPYRVYEINNEQYFEFFSPPYDKHRNKDDIKGVLFDTNRSYDEESIWYMMEQQRVAAFGDAKRFIEYIYPGDIVFFTHKWTGLVAAARVKKGKIFKNEDNTYYRNVEFLTEVPVRNEEIAAMPFKEISKLLGKNFFWARTIKVPYLSERESKVLLDELKNYL